MKFSTHQRAHAACSTFQMRKRCLWWSMCHQIEYVYAQIFMGVCTQVFTCYSSDCIFLVSTEGMLTRSPSCNAPACTGSVRLSSRGIRQLEPDVFANMTSVTIMCVICMQYMLCILLITDVTYPVWLQISSGQWDHCCAWGDVPGPHFSLSFVSLSWALLATYMCMHVYVWFVSCIQVNIAQAVTLSVYICAQVSQQQPDIFAAWGRIPALHVTLVLVSPVDWHVWPLWEMVQGLGVSKNMLLLCASVFLHACCIDHRQTSIQDDSCGLGTR